MQAAGETTELPPACRPAASRATCWPGDLQGSWWSDHERPRLPVGAPPVGHAAGTSPRLEGGASRG